MLVIKEKTYNSHKSIINLFNLILSRQVILHKIIGSHAYHLIIAIMTFIDRIITLKNCIFIHFVIVITQIHQITKNLLITNSCVAFRLSVKLKKRIASSQS